MPSSNQSAPNVTKEERDFSKASVSKSSKKTAPITVKLRTPVANDLRSRFLSPRKTLVHKGRI
jgi:hypothetical protein